MRNNPLLVSVSAYCLLGPSQIAQRARFEPVEDLFHGFGADPYVAPERKIEFCDREEDEGDDQGQCGHHENVNHGAVEAKEVGETYDHDPPINRTTQRMAGNP